MKSRPAQFYGRMDDVRRIRRRRAAALAVAVLTLALPVAALALPDLGEQGDGMLDTAVTPRAKDADPLGRTAWTHVAGARFSSLRAPDPGFPEGSPTPTEVDFLDVEMHGENLAFAVGSIDLGGTRVPVIYRYRRDARGDELWDEVYRSPEDRPGYAARVVWADPKTVLVVGGDGTFPDREKADGSGYCAPDEADPAAQDSAANGGAGAGRVWVLRDGEQWRELTDAEKPADLRALTALDSYYNADPDTKLSFAAAGGLCQIWHLQDGEFMRAPDGGFAPPYDTERAPPFEKPEFKPVDPEDPFRIFGEVIAAPKQTWNRPRFRLRVREIRFAETRAIPVQHRHVRAIAVTSGCCAAGDEQRSIDAQLLHYKPPAEEGGDAARGSWRVAPDSEAVTAEADELKPLDSVYATTYTQVDPTNPQSSTFASWRLHQLLATARPRSDDDPDLEQPSTWADSGTPNDDTGAPDGSIVPTQFSSMRLVAGAGNADGIRTPLDWAVGTLEATGQGALLSTNREQVPAPTSRSTFGCPSTTTLGPDCLDVQEGVSETRRSQTSYTLLKVPLYGLAGVDVHDETGTGWAVGRYGGIARFTDPRFGSSAGLGQEPGPPAVGQGPETVFSGGLYDAFKTAARPRAGEVPPLGAQPTLTLGRPQVSPGGSVPQDVRQVVMSEDGSEGVAIAGSGQQALVLHYRDAYWRPCYGEAIDTRFPADPACEGLPVDKIDFLVTAPTRDGQGFSAVAVDSGALGNDLYVYRDGAWQPFPHPVPHGGAFREEFRKLVFTTPDEAWAQGFNSASGDDSLQNIFHYDARRSGEKWIACTIPPPLGEGVRKLAGNCNDPEGRLDFGVRLPVANEPPEVAKSFTFGLAVASPKIVGMTAANGRAYFYGSRVSRAGFRYPAILVYDGEKWTADPAVGGWDPGCPRLEDRVCQDPVDSAVEDMGSVDALAIDDAGDGVTGWAFGSYVPRTAVPATTENLASIATSGANRARYAVARYADGAWAPVAAGSALTDYPMPRVAFTAPPRAGSVGGYDAVSARGSRLLHYEPRRERFELADAGRPPADLSAAPEGNISVVGAARGSAWLGIGNTLFQYTREPRQEVFEEVGHPIRDLGANGGVTGPEGSLWLITPSGRVYRHDRLTGWDTIGIPGWNAGRFVTAAAPANAIAVGASGDGLIVGSQGRIARITGRTVTLDRATTAHRCEEESPAPPCGTGWDLRGAAVAPDGSGLVVGDRRVILWRPPGEDFRTIQTPAVPSSVGFTAVSMPTDDRAWVVTVDGRIFAGTREGTTWTWRDESRDVNGKFVAIDRGLTRVRLNAVAVRADGTGVAVGDRGLLLERAASGPWSRVDSGVTSDLVSLAVAEEGGAIAGGMGGLVLTRSGGRWQPARQARFPFGKKSPHGDTWVVALADAPGDDGIEAWAVTSRPTGGRTHVWRYTDSGAPIADPNAHLRPLPDAPAPRPGELALAAWGKTDCPSRIEGDTPCGEMQATQSYETTRALRIVEEISRAADQGRIHAAVFTGDAVDAAGHQGSHVTGESGVPFEVGMPANGRRKLERWREIVADRLEDNGVPFLAGVGGQDLAANQVCTISCTSPSRFVHAGENFVWRSVMDGRLGSGPAGPHQLEDDGLRFRQVGIGSMSRRAEDLHPPGAEEPLPTGGGADTHFALDVEDAETDAPRLRIVFADTSLRSLSASDPVQQPLEPRGGQALWLEGMLCFAPGESAGGEPCTRRPGQPAVVVTNTPTYTYYAGALATQPDGAAFEEIMLRHRVSGVVTGRIGWNALYWTLAPALHSPCPGGEHPEGPPDTANPCGDGPQGGSFGGPPGSEQLTSALGGVAPPPPGEAPEPPDGFGENDTLPGQDGPPVPFVVASGGGGKFASEAEADGGRASDGFWHGYSVIRIAASGNSGETIVEQRPIYDFLTIEAQERSLRPGQRMTLRGWGRSPASTNASGAQYLVRYDRIDSPAVTHRYDLVLADPARPYLPLEDPNGDYVGVPPQVATINRQTGLIRARRGRSERTYAIGLLSVGDKVAGYPLAFEPRRSFASQRAKITLPPLPRVARAPAAQPPIRIGEATPPPPAAPPAAPASPISSQTLQPPQPPALPSLAAAPAPPAPQAPAPPAIAPPPPPPAPPNVPPQQQPQPLALSAKLQAVSIVPSVNPPAPPPVNPAPPAGSAARKEAKQRQAATAKSEEGAGDSADGDGAQARVNTASDPSHGSSRIAPEPHAFTRLERPEASAGARAVVYGGGLGLAAFALAAAFLTLRPRPRDRRPPLPAPATARKGTEPFLSRRQ